MKYKIIKDKHIFNKRYVWHEGYCLGFFNQKMIENKNIDWPKYRADKTLRININERWHVKYFPVAFPHERCDAVNSIEEAVESIIKKHKNAFANLLKEG